MGLVGKMRLAVAWFLVMLAVILGTLAWLNEDGQRPAPYETPLMGTVCYEDMDCWDWRTMGNKRRGVCIDGVNVLEYADGRMTPGGRGCDAD